LFEQKEAEEEENESVGSEEARWRPMDAEDLDPTLSQVSLGGMMYDMGLNEMNDKG